VADIMTIQTPSLGDRSYLVTDAGRTVTAIDDDFGRAALTGLPVTAIPAAAAA
jgi:hypothetical protein